MAYEQLEELEARLASLGYSCVMQRPPLGVVGHGEFFPLEGWKGAAKPSDLQERLYRYTCNTHDLGVDLSPPVSSAPFWFLRKKKGLKSEEHPTGNASFFKAERFELCASEIAGEDAVSGTDWKPLGFCPEQERPRLGGTPKPHSLAGLAGQVEQFGAHGFVSWVEDFFEPLVSSLFWLLNQLKD